MSVLILVRSAFVCKNARGNAASVVGTDSTPSHFSLVADKIYGEGALGMPKASAFSRRLRFGEHFWRRSQGRGERVPTHATHERTGKSHETSQECLGYGGSPLHFRAWITDHLGFNSWSAGTRRPRRATMESAALNTEIAIGSKDRKDAAVLPFSPMPRRDFLWRFGGGLEASP